MEKSSWGRPFAGLTLGPPSPACYDKLSDHGAGLQLGVGFLKICGIDWPESFAKNTFDFALVDPVGNSIEQPVLLNHVSRLILRPSEYQFPDMGRTFELEDLLTQESL